MVDQNNPKGFSLMIIRTAMNDPSAALVILLFRAPSILESTKRSQNRATNPDRIFALWRGQNLDLKKINRITINPSDIESEEMAKQTFTPEGDRALSSFCIRSAMPGNIVVPPERTTLPYKSRRMSRSHLKIDWCLS